MASKAKGPAGLPSATLRAERGPLAPQRIIVHHSPFTIGRSTNNDLVLSEARVSRQHARLEWWQGRWFLHDLNSANGIFLNRQRLTTPQPLHSGDLIGIGESVFLFTAEALPPVPPQPTAKPRRSGLVVGVAVGTVLLMLAIAATLLISARPAKEEEAAPAPGLPTVAIPTVVLPTMEIPTIPLPPAIPTVEVPPAIPTVSALPTLGLRIPTIPWPPPKETPP